ncbi:DUF397 domain-containing protein [Actinomadura welshii]
MAGAPCPTQTGRIGVQTGSAPFAWRKSSHSSSEPQTCVECTTVVPAPNAVIGVRDSTDPDGPRLTLTPDAWCTLLVQLKRERRRAI